MGEGNCSGDFTQIPRLLLKWRGRTGLGTQGYVQLWLSDTSAVIPAVIRQAHADLPSSAEMVPEKWFKGYFFLQDQE